MVKTGTQRTRRRHHAHEERAERCRIPPHGSGSARWRRRPCSPSVSVIAVETIATISELVRKRTFAGSLQHGLVVGQRRHEEEGGRVAEELCFLVFKDVASMTMMGPSAISARTTTIAYQPGEAGRLTALAAMFRLPPRPPRGGPASSRILLNRRARASAS